MEDVHYLVIMDDGAVYPREEEARGFYGGHMCLLDGLRERYNLQALVAYEPHTFLLERFVEDTYVVDVPGHGEVLFQTRPLDNLCAYVGRYPALRGRFVTHLLVPDDQRVVERLSLEDVFNPVGLSPED